MKDLKVYIKVLLVLIAFSSCGGSEGDSTPATNNPPVTYTQSVTLPASETEQSVVVSSINKAITTIENSSNWLTASPESYTSGNPRVRLFATKNTSTTERSCNIILHASSGEKVVLIVTQSGTGSSGDNGIEDIHDETTTQPAYAPSF